MALMVSVSGIRGIFGSHLTPENLVTYAAAFGHWADGGSMVVGRDSRTTGQICEDLVCATLQSCGCDVIRTGIAPTPTVAMAVERHQAAGGVILTASHNPAEWNALKLLNHKGEFLDQQQGEQVLKRAEEKDFTFRPHDRIGSTRMDPQAIQAHIDAILQLPYIHPDEIRESEFTVAVDAVNGAGSIALPQLLDQLGVKVRPIHCTPNGHFPHNPEPLPEHLTEICEFIRNNPCDLGLATDPDADRLALIDETGTLFGEEYTQVSAFDFLLSKKKGPTATNLSSSRAAEEISRKYGVACHRSPVGEINVVKVMQKVGAVIGGEGNGGVINPDLHYGRDALAGAAMILQLLAERKLTASAYRATLPDYQIVKQKVGLNRLGMEADSALTLLAERFAGQNPDTSDGVKIDFEEGWVHIRKSNTEPILRIYSEAASAEQAKTLADQVLQEATNDNQTETP